MSLSKIQGKKAVKGKSAAIATGNPALDLFHRHWQELEKQQVKLEKKNQEKHAIYQRFTEHIEPLERQQCELIFQLAERLVGFTARKSFTGWQREELHDWLQELITYLESNPFRGEMDMGSLFKQIHANTTLHMDEEMLDAQCEFLRQMLLETCGHCPEDPADLLEMVKKPEKMHEYLLHAAKGAVADADESGDDAFFAEDDAIDDDALFGNGAGYDGYAYARASREKQQAERAEVLFSKSSLKQLYRKLALVLHPDREQDPALQEEKTRIMSKLSHAWEQKDMFTLLQLAHTHLPEAENLLSDENLAVINPMLKQRIRELEWDGIRRSEGIMGAVLHRFQCRSRKKTDQAFAEHHDYLDRDIASLTKMLSSIRCMKTLKPFLADRSEARMQQAWDEEIEFSFF